MKVIFGRQFRRSLTILALAGALAAIGQASALAGSGTHTAPIYAGKSDCGSANTNYTEIGSISISRSGDTASVDVSLQGAVAGTYTVELWKPRAGGSCDRNVVFGELQTDGNGDASGSFSAQIAKSSGGRKFFVALARHTNGSIYYNDTTSFPLR